LSPAALESEARAALAVVGRALELPCWPKVPVRWNRRLRRAGRAVIDHRGARFRSAQIELSPTYFQVYPEDLHGILVHEAVHVGLAIQGRPFGHGPDFRRTCEMAGGLLHSRWLPGRVFRYRCPVCRLTHERRRRIADSRWCAACVVRAERTGEEPYDRTRALRLVETAFCGPEAAARARQPVCEGHGGGTPQREPAADPPLRYPGGESDTRAPRAGAR
jgi:predicted SprT family Zn-dependent metalloprotease